MRTKREIKPLLNQLSTPKWESTYMRDEKGVVIPIKEPIDNETKFAILIKKIFAKRLHKSRIEMQKFLTKYHIKVKKHSRKTFRRKQ